MNTENEKYAIQSLLKARAVTVVMGAGVSVAAGIPAFRGSGGIHAQKMDDVAIKDLMSINALKDVSMLENHCKLIASLAKKAALAKPTPFHTLLQVLENGNKIQRIYTQNIDGLESKVGFDLLGSDFSAMRCVPLHGSLFQLRCTVCSARQPLEYNFHDLESGNLPHCGICKATSTKRGNEGLRLRTSGHLRPDIVLYDEEVYKGELIMTMVLSDAQDVSDGHVLLVVGTSLQIPGIANIVKIIGSAVESVKGDVIYLDHNAPMASLANRFSVCVQGDCQRFAEAAIALLTEEKPTVSEEISYINAVEQRRDMRPLWDWL